MNPTAEMFSEEPDEPKATKPAPESSPLHLVHAGHDATGKGWRVDIGWSSWRVESQAAGEVKKAMALRLAVCWNVLEGIPTEALLAGAVRDFYAAALEMAAELGEGHPLTVRLRAADHAHHLQAVSCKQCARTA